MSAVVEGLFTEKSSQFLEIYFLFQLRQAWRQVAGEEISQKASPIQFKNQILFLRLPDSTHIQEMHFAKEVLKNKINQHFPDYKIKKILFKA